MLAVRTATPRQTISSCTRVDTAHHREARRARPTRRRARLATAEGVVVAEVAAAATAAVVVVVVDDTAAAIGVVPVAAEFKLLCVSRAA